ncbi:GET complex subunit get1 [Elasticomyces elasticus]|nr:GET complex subunit get1 [Elasticomyces elasticus]
MVSLLLVVFLVQISIYAINVIGKVAVNDLLWSYSARLLLPSSKDAREASKLKAEVLRQKKEMAAISAQDDFARWAKLRREHDKAQAVYDAKGEFVGIAAALQSHRSSFDTMANIARWLLTTGMQSFLQFWHSKSPIFLYPKGWLPWPVEWILAFPRCQYGAVSINIWSMVCGTVIALVGTMVSEMVGCILAQTVKPDVTSEKVKI